MGGLVGVENTNLEWKLLQQLSPKVEQAEVEQVILLLAELSPTTELALDQTLGLGFLLPHLLPVLLSLLVPSLTFKQILIPVISFTTNLLSHTLVEVARGLSSSWELRETINFSSMPASVESWRS